MYFNPCLSTDSYKTTHAKQYPPGTVGIYSYWESRGGLYPECVPYGLRYILKRNMPDMVTREDIDYAERFLNKHFGRNYFNRESWEKLAARKQQPLPLIIKAVPEGTIVPTGNVMMTVKNTEPEFYWLTNFVETILCQAWYPTTVATHSREIKKTILAGLKKSGTPESIDFKLHDFGMRGATCMEAAALGGSAHLVNFQGTDTLPAIEFINEFYNQSQYEMWGYSVAASEHSTMTSWTRQREADAYANMLDKYPEGVVSIVSDSYDVFHACKEIFGNTLKNKVLERPGVLVVRPDSGPPVETLLKVIETLGEAFGFYDNQKGYKVLNDKVRVLWGDGIGHPEVKKIIKNLHKNKLSLDNVACFGMGAGLLQNLNRDTQKLAFKCSSARIYDQQVDVYKEPVTQSYKRSKRGRLKLVRDDDGKFVTVPDSDVRRDEMVEFYNPQEGLCHYDYFGDIRKRAAIV